MAGKKGTWKKGQSGNLKGRPPILYPELQREIDTNKNALKKLILQYLSMTEMQINARQIDRTIPFVEKLIGQILERTANDGDMFKFKMLLEIVFGKLPEDKDPFDMTAEEKMMIITYRKRIDEERKSLTAGPQDHSRDD